jgi:hypothetical protein
MNDFLQQLRNSADYKRNGNDKRFNKSRKPYAGNLYQGNDNQRDRNRNAQPETGQDKLTAIQKILGSIAETQTRLADIEERRAEAEERKVLALERGVRFINEISEQLTAHDKDNAQSLLKTLSAAIQPEMKPMFHKTDDEYRQRVLQVIIQMREAHATYEEIASHLELQNMPTFSGRGAWHAQTIHRICQQLSC